MNVGHNTTSSDGNVTEKLVQFFVIADGELQVTGRDGLLLINRGSVTSQFKDFSGQVFQDSSQVDWSSGTDTLSVVTLAQEAVDTTDWELESSLFRARA